MIGGMGSGGLVRFDGLLLSLDHEDKGGLLFRGVVQDRKYQVRILYIHHINRGFGSRGKNWGPFKFAQTSLRTLLYDGSPVRCGAVAWLVFVAVTILVRREVK